MRRSPPHPALPSFPPVKALQWAALRGLEGEGVWKKTLKLTALCVCLDPQAQSATVSQWGSQLWAEKRYSGDAVISHNFYCYCNNILHIIYYYESIRFTAIA